METKFKKIIQSAKAWKEGVAPLSRTFEGDLFKESSWVFLFNEAELATEAEVIEKASVKVDVILPKAETLVLFLGDTHQEGQGEDLLGKMIQAMKLKEGEFNRVLFDEKLDEIMDPSSNLIEPSAETKNIFEQINKFKPAIVVTLGATVTNILLGKREKLSGIHGQFFDKTLIFEGKSHSYQLMPLFHPEFLKINPNMKRTAWIDLQKVMERIGKI